MFVTSSVRLFLQWTGTDIWQIYCFFVHLQFIFLWIIQLLQWFTFLLSISSLQNSSLRVIEENNENNSLRIMLHLICIKIKFKFNVIKTMYENSLQVAWICNRFQRLYVCCFFKSFESLLLHDCFNYCTKWLETIGFFI